MGNIFNNNFSDENKINISTKNEIDYHFKKIRNSISYSNRNYFDSFFKKLINDYYGYKDSNICRVRCEITEDYIDQICIYNTEVLNLIIENLKTELDMKNNEIEFLKLNKKKIEFNNTNKNKRKKINDLQKKLDCYPRKIRKSTIDYKKRLYNFESSFDKCCPKSYKNDNLLKKII